MLYFLIIYLCIGFLTAFTIHIAHGFGLCDETKPETLFILGGICIAWGIILLLICILFIVMGLGFGIMKLAQFAKNLWDGIYSV